MFTRFAKGFLRFLIGLFALVTIIGAFAVAKAVNWNGRYMGRSIIAFIVALLVLALISIFILLGFGLAVELCNNVLDIKQMLKENGGFDINSSDAPRKAAKPPKIQPVNQNPQMNPPYNPQINPQPGAAPMSNGMPDNNAPVSQGQEPINCPNCGMPNDSNYAFCQNCGVKLVP